MFVCMSDGSIQNKYILKVLNKTDKDVYVAVSATGGVKGSLLSVLSTLLIQHGRVTA